MAYQHPRTLQVIRPAQLLPDTIDDFFTALNEEDVAGLVRGFGSDAVINDQMQELSGIEQIIRWAEHDMTGLHVRATIQDTRLRPSGAIVSAKITGDFDAPGLPEPLILLFYFVLSDNLIDQLVILRSGV
jgi:hypothetical protein